jgi:hypothetical protein
VQAIRPLLRLLTQPRPAEARDIGAFAHSDGLADDANSTAILPADLRVRELVPTRSGRATLRSSEWRPGIVALLTSSTIGRLSASQGLSALKLLGGAGMARRGRRVVRRSDNGHG